MSFITFSKRNILAILTGTIVALIIQSIAFYGFFYIDSQIISQIPHNSTLEEFKSAHTFASNQQPYAALSVILNILIFLSPLIGGFIGGRLVHEKGWLYGGISGFIFTVILIVMYLFTAFFIPQFPNEEKAEVPQTVLNYFLYSPMAILLGATGGYLGKFLQNRNRKKK